MKLGPLARRVLTVSDALTWLKRTFEPTQVSLPLVEEKFAHQIDTKDDIFDSLRKGYPSLMTGGERSALPSIGAPGS